MTTSSEIRNSFTHDEFGQAYYPPQVSPERADLNSVPLEERETNSTFLRRNILATPALRLATIQPQEASEVNDQPEDVENAHSLRTVELPDPPEYVMEKWPPNRPSRDIATATSVYTDFGGGTPTIGKTMIPSGWTFSGEISGASDMQFECNLIANVECTNPAASIELGVKCVSEGRVTGKQIRVQGQHKGAINAAGGRVVIEATSKITGDVTYSLMQMNEGTRHNFALHYAEAQSESDVTNA